MEYILIRSNRRSLSIKITENATVEVRAPAKMSKRNIDEVIASKQSWIDSHLSVIMQRTAQKSAFSVNYGDSILYCGKNYTVTAVDGSHAYFDDGFFVPKNLNSNEIKYVIIKLYKKLAEACFTSKVQYYAGLINVAPAAVKINSAKTRWGSCSGKNSINFSWRLVLAPSDAIDYVVVHELCHIKEHNHSSKFWAQVQEVIKDYKMREMQLKQLQNKLSKESWE